MDKQNKVLEEIEKRCGDCEAWSGTDCTRNPITQDCLKESKQSEEEVRQAEYWRERAQMWKQAAHDIRKETAEKFAAKAKAKARPAFVNIDSNPRKDGYILLSDIDDICKEITEG